MQAKGLPDTVRVITGRFDRNPPLYYEMRIKRESAQLQKSPRQFGLYDDVAVALDWLGRDAEALSVMERKRGALPAYNPKNPAVKESWYRYYANAGTFHVHHWLSEGAKAANISEMKLAQRYIKRAIEIKPNAHFGRERYQLMTMDWIVAVRDKPVGGAGTLGSWIASQDGWDEANNPDQQRKEATKGLSGLIVLGAAWQSADIFEALASALDRDDAVTLHYLALLRCREILRSGKKSLDPEALNESVVEQELNGWQSAEKGVYGENQQTLRQLYPKLRAEAETWESQRTGYALGRLVNGLHPDTTPLFWADWHPLDPPSLDVPWYHHPTPNEMLVQALIALFIFLAGGIFILVMGVKVIRKLIRKRTA